MKRAPIRASFPAKPLLSEIRIRMSPSPSFVHGSSLPARQHCGIMPRACPRHIRRNDMGKKVLFIGAGAIGSYLGAFLSRAGHDVTLVDPWADQVETIRARHVVRSEEHTSELQSRLHLVCRLLLEKKKKNKS